MDSAPKRPLWPLVAGLLLVAAGDGEPLSMDDWKTQTSCPEGAVMKTLGETRTGCAMGERKHGPVSDWRDGWLQTLAHYRDDVRHGTWTRFFSPGVKYSEGEYVDGQQHGPWHTWHEDGQVHTEQRWANGKRDGRWVYYYPNGQKSSEAVFREGAVIGTSNNWYENGQLKGKVEHDAKTGRHRIETWREDGTREKAGVSADETRVGTWKQWDTKDRLSLVEKFDDRGYLHRVIEYRDGKKVKVRNLKPPMPPRPRMH